MLDAHHKRQGFSLIELLIGIAILGLLLGIGVPSFSAWLQNMQVRNAAESIQNGLQLARAEAVRRNTQVKFTMAGPKSDWRVEVVIPPVAPDSALVQTHSSDEGAANAQIVTSNGTVTFDGLGKTDLATSASIQVTNPVVAAGCGTGLGQIRCLNITVSVGGQVKMCDPQIATAGDSRKC